MRVTTQQTYVSMTQSFNDLSGDLAHVVEQMATGKQILQLLQDTCRREGITVIIITHNSALAPMADRLIRFKSGKVTDETLQPNPTPIEQIEW